MPIIDTIVVIVIIGILGFLLWKWFQPVFSGLFDPIKRLFNKTAEEKRITKITTITYE